MSESELLNSELLSERESKTESAGNESETECE